MPTQQHMFLFFEALAELPEKVTVATEVMSIFCA